MLTCILLQSLIKNMSSDGAQASRMSLESGQFVFHYIIEGGVCYLTLTGTPPPPPIPPPGPLFSVSVHVCVRACLPACCLMSSEGFTAKMQGPGGCPHSSTPLQLDPASKYLLTSFEPTLRLKMPR